MNDREMLKALDSGKCPNCGGRKFLKGPQGGCSTNIKCGNCGFEFNYTPGFWAERIDRSEVHKD